MMLFGGLVAQLVEQCPFKALVQGSSPCQPTSLRSEPRRRAKTAAPKRSEGGLRGTFAQRSELRLGKPVEMKFFYVYILQSEIDKGRFYSGLTEDLRARLKKHNAGDVPYRPNSVRGG